jgi:hypothetical protein
MDEAARQSHWALKNLEERLLSTNGPMLLTTTPKGKNWVYDLTKDPNVGVALLKTKDNPHITQEAIQSLAERWGTNSDYYRQELEAEFITFEGLVYAFDFEKDVITQVQVPEIPRLFLGVDWGSADPLAIGVWGRHEGVWYKLDEFYQTHVSLDDLAKILQGFMSTYPNIVRGWMSWERPEIAQLLRGRGIPIQCAKKEDVGEGCAYIDGLIRNRQLKVVGATCPNTLLEFGQYQYRSYKTGERKPGEKPLDRDNHSMDEMRMVVRSEMNTFVRPSKPYSYRPENSNTAY